MWAIWQRMSESAQSDSAPLGLASILEGCADGSLRRPQYKEAIAKLRADGTLTQSEAVQAYADAAQLRLHVVRASNTVKLGN